MNFTKIFRIQPNAKYFERSLFLSIEPIKSPQPPDYQCSLVNFGQKQHYCCGRGEVTLFRYLLQLTVYKQKRTMCSSKIENACFLL